MRQAAQSRVPKNKYKKFIRYKKKKRERVTHLNGKTALRLMDSQDPTIVFDPMDAIGWKIRRVVVTIICTLLR